MTDNLPSFNKPHFDGAEYVTELDEKRLTGQILKIYGIMVDGSWRTLKEIEDLTGYPQASISAQLRNLRKDRFGNHIVEKRRRGGLTKGLFEYRVWTT